MQALHQTSATYLFESSWKCAYSARRVRKILARYSQAAGQTPPISPHQHAARSRIAGVVEGADLLGRVAWGGRGKQTGGEGRLMHLDAAAVGMDDFHDTLQGPGRNRQQRGNWGGP
jgi:hypothetical protein